MAMETDKASRLLNKFKEGSCTEEEIELLRFCAHHFNDDSLHNLTETDLLEAQTDMWQAIKKQQNAKLKRLYWPRVAAAILILAAIAALFKTFQQDKDKLPANERLANLINIGGNKAVLTLSDGKKIILDDAADLTVINDGKMRITKSVGGQLVYTVLGSNAGQPNREAEFNTLTTPKGGQYQLNLPDGTRIWLNAASSIRFPVVFNNKREVELSGEGYFEVKHLSGYQGEKVPFRVKTSGRNSELVEVLGTHFNINAYTDESAVKTTLLDGSIRLTSLQNTKDNELSPSTILKPGEQSILNTSGIAVVQADTDEAIAWKNGYFRFNDEILESIMRKVEKWYNVETIYKSENLRKKSFAGVTTRYANVADLLRMLELTGEVKFTIVGNQIIVTDTK